MKDVSTRIQEFKPPAKFANIWEIQQMKQEHASHELLKVHASYLSTCNVAVQEISQVRKENISNEQKQKWLFTHTSFKW